MDKLPIRDPTINLVPSKELQKFIGSLKVTSSAPANIQNIHRLFQTSKGKKTAKVPPLQEAEKIAVSSKVDFTEKEYNLIQQYVTNGSDAIHSSDNANVLTHDPMEEHEPLSPTAASTVLKLSDVKWLYTLLNQMRDSDPSTPFLHSLLKGCLIKLPTNPVQERNPELEKRCQRLRKEQEDREYHRMTKNVDSVRKHMPEETIAYQMKQINRHLIAVAQFVFSVAAGFAFGFIGIELIIGQLDFGFRLLLGIIIALVIALAEIYFLAKKLNEEYELPPTPAMVSQPSPSNVVKTIPGKTNKKEHKE